MEIVEVQHLPVVQGRQVLKAMNPSDLGIPSITPTLTTRWQAGWKEKFLDPGENQKFLKEILDYVSTLTDVTTQRAIYYALRGRHPEWTYKGGPLGDQFYEHLVMWIMEKAQLMTGMTMQSMGIWAAPRGYVTGDGTIQTRTRGRAPLNAKPALGFDMADTGMILSTHAKKVIHFEKDAGLDALTSGNFPRFIEAVFSTSQGQLTEAANKFLRECENRGMDLYSVHDGDPSGIQMQLLYGMATKNNCYMPSEFYPTLVRPLGFYPSIGEALGLPPEDVTEKEDKIFDNLLDLLEGKQKNFPELRRFGLANEVEVIVRDRQKWEFQALNAIHEQAPKIYLLEGLRVHEDPIKYVPEASSIKERVVSDARTLASEAADRAVEGLARELVEGTVPALVETLRGGLAEELLKFRQQVEAALAALAEIPDDAFREYVKRQLIAKPEKYAPQVIASMAQSFVDVVFHPKAELSFSFEIEGLQVRTKVDIAAPRTDYTPVGKTMLVDAIEAEILSNKRTRDRVVGLIRGALEERFGEPDEQW